MFQPFDSHTHYGVSLMLRQATETRITTWLTYPDINGNDLAINPVYVQSLAVGQNADETLVLVIGAQVAVRAPLSQVLEDLRKGQVTVEL